jgi:hypothetical protein
VVELAQKSFAIEEPRIGKFGVCTFHGSGLGYRCQIWLGGFDEGLAVDLGRGQE